MRGPKGVFISSGVLLLPNGQMNLGIEGILQLLSAFALNQNGVPDALAQINATRVNYTKLISWTASTASIRSRTSSWPITAHSFITHRWPERCGRPAATATAVSPTAMNLKSDGHTVQGPFGAPGLPFAVGFVGLLDRRLLVFRDKG